MVGLKMDIQSQRNRNDNYRLDEPVIGSQKKMEWLYRRWTKEIQPIHNQQMVIDGYGVHRDSKLFSEVFNRSVKTKRSL